MTITMLPPADIAELPELHRRLEEEIEKRDSPGHHRYNGDLIEALRRKIDYLEAKASLKDYPEALLAPDEPFFVGLTPAESIDALLFLEEKAPPL